MDHLRSSIGLRRYAQKDPLVEYRHEAFKMFDELMAEIKQEIIVNMFRSATSLAAFERMLSAMPQKLIHDQIGQFDLGETVSASGLADGGGEAPPPMPQINITFRRDLPKVGRNDPCPCGSGKKYKKCCG
jgi:preprotein translocase subunit SecA